mmetsp:Transcript_8958/g.55095  ORF Transcript_8958/g.55095 Transcript_8958/m.55095 type:complete len:112 (+) Transcript_8958:279-614(+)
MNNVRPFVLAAVLLLLFLSTQSDWQQDKNGLESRRNVSRTTGTEKEVVKEKIIVELSSTNQKLEEENNHLKAEIEILKVRFQHCTRNRTLEGPSPNASDSAGELPGNHTAE